MLEKQTLNEDLNPIDSLESVLSGYNWVFDRMNEEELFVKLSGEENDYSVYFLWDDATQLLQICCQYDLQIADANLNAAHSTLLELNENLHLGHFDLPRKSNKPSFRYSAMMRDLSQDQGHRLMNDLVEMSLSQCERHSTTFKMLTAPVELCPLDLNLALMETQGRS